MPDVQLSPQQVQVIDALSSGATMIDAAEAAGVHRNTIANWRRNHGVFRDALSNAQYDRALIVREQFETRVDAALQTLDSLLADSKTPASIRLKAALSILEKASTPPEPQPEVVWEIRPTQFKYPSPVPKDAQNAQSALPNPPKMQNNAQPVPGIRVNLPSPAAKTPQTIRHESPKVGRNDQCPCGSGQKFKRCCLNKVSLNKTKSMAA